MAEDCTSVNIPALETIEDPCNGKHTSTECVYTPSAIAYLGISADATLAQVIAAIVTKLQEID